MIHERRIQPEIPLDQRQFVARSLLAENNSIVTRQSDALQAVATSIAERTIVAMISEPTPQKAADFEPFVQEQPGGLWPRRRNRFINNYDGPYAMRMELNRTSVERFIHLSRFEGDIHLGFLPYSTQRAYLEANPDGSVASKRGLTIGERNVEEEENPYYRAIATGDGWAMLMNGQRILEDARAKTAETKVMERRFVGAFNGILRHALVECLTKEKLSPAKDMFFGQKVFDTMIQPVMAATWSATFHHGSVEEFVFDLAGSMVTIVPAAYALSAVFASRYNPDYWEQNPRQGIQIFLPPLRIEDVVIGKAYLGIKGRTLVRSQKEEKK